MLQEQIKAKVDTLKSIIYLCDAMIQENPDSDAIAILNYCKNQLDSLKKLVKELNSRNS